MIFKTGTSARIFLAIVVALGLILFFSRGGNPGDEFTVAGAPFVVGGAEVSKVLENGAEIPLDIVSSENGPSTRVRLTNDANLTVRLKNGSEIARSVRARGRAYLYWIVFLFVLIALVTPFALDASWYGLLSEKGGGYSLSRVQLLLWFMPAVILYSAESFCVHAFVPLEQQLAMLLGLSGATSLLGAASSPARPNADEVKRDLKDLVTDWDSHGDVSRYQYLLISFFGALVLVGGFLQKLEFPQIPSQLFYLIAASQGTYVANKAVKAAKRDDSTPAPEASAAPGTINSVPPDRNGKDVPAAPGMSGPNGSFARPPQG